MDGDSLHLAYGRLDSGWARGKKKRKLVFTSHGDTEELTRHLRPHLRRRIMDARIVRQRAAARS